MRILAIIVVVVATAFLTIGGFIVIASGEIKFLSPNALLRLADTSLLFAIAISLLTIVSKKNE